MMKAAGIFRACVARRFGGDETSPGDFLRLIEAISEADGSAGWVASFGSSAIYLSALPIATLETIYSNGPDVVFAGGISPPQNAIPVEGGLEVSGQWSWGSGCTGAALIGVGIKVEGGGLADGLPRMAVLPRDKVRIVHNWDVNGLKGVRQSGICPLHAGTRSRSVTMPGLGAASSIYCPTASGGIGRPSRNP
jgi:indole-3-acetate monooxygenase